MGLLESVIGALGQGGGQGMGQGAGAQDDLLAAAGALLGPDGGGLGALLGQLQQGGLGEAASSWVGTGQNMPVSPEQLEGALGADGIAQLARQFGLDGGGLDGGMRGGLGGGMSTDGGGGLGDLLGGALGGGGTGGAMGGAGGGLGGVLGSMLGGGGAGTGGGASPIAAILAQLLPLLVDWLTPNGQVPQAGGAPGGQDLAGLLAGLGPR